MKNAVTTLCLLTLSLVASAQNRTYFISPGGNDQASGLSIQLAWKSLDKVNSIIFQPGDQVLFESGASWKGQLKLQGSGAKDNPIQLSGYGGKARPVINIGEAEGAGIRLNNQSWWIVDNLEVTSGAAPTLGIGRQGIVALVQGDHQQVAHLIIRNCYVHDIWGQLGGNTEYTGYNSCAILVQVQGRRGGINRPQPGISLNDVLIEDNRIERVDKCGIIVRGCQNNLLVRRNYMDNLGGDGIFVGGCYRGIIEYNTARRTCMRSGYVDLAGGASWWPHTAAIWLQDAQEALMQYNEVYDTGRQPGNGDGFAYDFDFNCKRCIAQYNYSKNNHGFLLLMNRTFENVTRYNISENDQTHLIQMQCAISERNSLYNNVFYIDYGTVDLDFFCGNTGTADKSKLGAVYYNNIFYATGQSHFRTAYSSGPVLSRTFDDSTRVPRGGPGQLFYHNCYFGPWKNGVPDDPEKLMADPLLVAPGSGGDGLSSLAGYQLKPASPCLNTGLGIPFPGNRDFWGNPLSDGHPDVGAYEQIGSGVFADAAKQGAVERSYAKESEMALAKWIFPTQILLGATDTELLIKLVEPLGEQVRGSLSWTDAGGKVSVLALDKAKKRDEFRVKLLAGQTASFARPVQVSLRYEDLLESWTIPIKERKMTN